MTADADPDGLSPPIADFIARDGAGAAHLRGSRCQGCGYTYVGDRSDCARCLARDCMSMVRLAETGTLHTWSIVHRSLPGVETPFIDAVVDLDDGSHLKGILRGVAPVPEDIRFDLPVRIRFRDVTPLGGDRPYLAYEFVAA